MTERLTPKNGKMAKLISLNKFVDSRGWSVNDIYAEAKKALRFDEFTVSTEDDKRPFDYQINYSLIHPGIVKAWHRHKHQDDYFFVLKGMAQVGVYSEEKGSEKFFIGEHNPALVHISAGEWHGITPLGNESCGLLYFVTREYSSHTPDEERTTWNDFVGHDWWHPEFK